MSNVPEIIRRISQDIAPVEIKEKLGRILEIKGPIAYAAYHGIEQGAVCELVRGGQKPILAEVVGVKGDNIMLLPFGSMEGMKAGDIVRRTEQSLALPVGQGLLGRVIDAFGAPVDQLGPIVGETIAQRIKVDPPAAVERPLIVAPLETGLRVLDGPLTFGSGQRLGLFGPPGTGKSSLLASIARQTAAEVIVLGLVGERGREVREFIERDLPEDARKKVVVVVSTSDRPPVERSLCAYSATAVAEFFRDTGKSVFLMIDSITRTARALREIGLAAGEAPTRRGYPASVYPALPAIFERAGRTSKADITALYTVLMEGDGDGDPIVEEVKSLTDGHIVLNRSLAMAGHFPAIDINESLSRCMKSVVKKEHNDAANDLRRLNAKYKEVELLIQIGEYKPGGDLEADQAVNAKPKVEAFLRQSMDERSDINSTFQMMAGVVL